MVRPLVLFISALLALPAAASAATDYGRDVYNVLPPGQAGDLPVTKHSADQLPMYDGLTPLWDRITAGDIPKYFKPERFGVVGRPEGTERPRRGLRIVRDSFGVPHIYGRTRDDVMFGAGWVTVQDRGLFIEILRGPARLAALDVPGVDAFAVANQLRQFQPSRAAERTIFRSGLALSRDRQGRRVLADVDAYLRGVNAQLRKQKSPAKPWTRADVAAVASLIGAVFGKGGGAEVRTSRLLGALQAKLGAEAGFGVWRDLTAQNEAESSATISKSFPYDRRPATLQPGSAIVDPAPAAGTAVDPPAAATRQLMSNALLVGARRSANGRPLFVMGPQVSYFYPQFLMELDLHGGGIDARGAAFPGISMYVLLGRGKDFAFSATSASNDNVDQFLEQLCNPDGSPATSASTSYLYKGKCRRMGSFDAGVLKAGGGEPERRLTYRTSVHGPISGTVTVGGKPYAVALARSTRGRDVQTARFFEALNTNRVRNARDFVRLATRDMLLTFNWFYADNRDIAMASTGRLPIRARGTYPGLPTIGTGRYDWRGFLSPKAHPQVINPSDGTILNWNNRPARNWAAADDNFSWTSVHRNELFRGIGQKVTVPQLVSVMNRAATQDLRATDVWPLIKDVLAGGPAPDAMTQQAADLVSAWSAAGASRLDSELDGKIDAPGAAVLDAAWSRLADAVLSPVLGDLTAQLAVAHERDDAAGNNGSSYGSGWYGYIDKDLRSLLGRPVTAPYSRRYCGGGDLAACRASLWAALEAAAKTLAEAQGPDPAAWRADANPERINFKPGVFTQTMRWANRPTFQQVGQFSGHRKR